MITAAVTVVLMLIVIKIYVKLSAGRCKSPICLTGKTALITGGNAGIGFETALVLAQRGCRVIIAGRNNVEEAKKEIISQTNNNNIAAHYLDLASINSVRNLAKQITTAEGRLDILINNAGTIGLGNSYTQDGLHIGMQVNHFGPFLLTHLLIGLLKKSAPSRIIFVGSFNMFASRLTLENLNYPENASSTYYSQHIAYANSKLCNTITANGFAKKLNGTGVTANSLHPGVVATTMFEKFCCRLACYEAITKGTSFLGTALMALLGKTPEEGAQTTLHVALSKELESVTGNYFWDCRSSAMPKLARDENFCRKIWEASEDYVKLADHEKL